MTDALTTTEVPTAPYEAHLQCLFYTEAETADLLGIHRTTLRNLALSGKAPCQPFQFTPHRRFYRRIEVDRLGGIEP